MYSVLAVVAGAAVVIVVVVVTILPTVHSANIPKKYSNLITEEEESNTKSRFNEFSDSFGTNLNHYVSIEEYEHFMKEINGSHPNMEVVTYGQSYEDRNLLAVKLYKHRCNPTIFIEAGIHAREWITTAVTLKILNYIAQSNSQDEDISKLLDVYNWVFVPLVNPDGYNYAHNEDRMWRKNRRIVNKYCAGVDLNRNFNISWGNADSNDNPCGDTYCGTAPFSEPETHSLKQLVTSSLPLVAYISLHSYSQMIITPYSYSDRKPQDLTDMIKVAMKVQMAIQNSTGKIYTAGEGSSILYKASGCSTDWAKAILGVKYVYAIEMRPLVNDTNGFVLPTSQIEPSAREIFIALKTFANSFDISFYYSSDYFKNCKHTNR